MRVLYFTDSWFPQVNGVSVATAMSVDGLRGRGWDCHVVAPRYPRDHQPRDPSVTVLRSVALPRYPIVRITLPDVRKAHAVVARLAPDIVHCQTEFIVGRLGQLAARRAGIPVVTSYHTDFSKYCTAYGLTFLRGAVVAYLTRFHQRAARTLTPSAASCDSLRHMGLEHIQRWGTTVDPRRFGPQFASRELRRTLGLGDAFTFLFVGRLAPEKRVDLVLEAYRRVEARLSAGSVRLLIVGAGPLEEQLRRAAPGTAQFLGERRHDLPTIYATADALVFASTTETLGLVVLEAMSSGLPVIAPMAGGLTEYLRSGENSLACPPGDTERMAIAMQRLVHDAALRATLRHGALATAASLNWDVELDRLEMCYSEVVDAAKSEVPITGMHHAAPVDMLPLRAR